MKPIEPGCLCITQKCKIPSNNGRSVTVIRYVGKHYSNGDISLSPVWLTDKVTPSIFINSGKPAASSAECPEHHLMRIDGYEDEITETEQELVK